MKSVSGTGLPSVVVASFYLITKGKAQAGTLWHAASLKAFDIMIQAGILRSRTLTTLPAPMNIFTKIGVTHIPFI